MLYFFFDNIQSFFIEKKYIDPIKIIELLNIQNIDEKIDGPEDKYIFNKERICEGNCSVIDIIPIPPPKEKNQKSLFIVCIVFRKSRNISLLKKKSIEYINKSIKRDRKNLLKNFFPL